MKAWAEEVRRTVEGVVKGAAGEKVVLLVLENPDVLLAAGGVGAMDLVAEILEWHLVCLLQPSVPTLC